MTAKGLKGECMALEDFSGLFKTFHGISGLFRTFQDSIVITCISWKLLSSSNISLLQIGFSWLNWTITTLLTCARKSPLCACLFDPTVLQLSIAPLTLIIQRSLLGMIILNCLSFPLNCLSPHEGTYHSFTMWSMSLKISGHIPPIVF